MSTRSEGGQEVQAAEQVLQEEAVVEEGVYSDVNVYIYIYIYNHHHPSSL